MKMSSLIFMIIFLPEKQISKRLNTSIPFLSLFHEMISMLGYLINKSSSISSRLASNCIRRNLEDFFPDMKQI